MIKPSNQVKNFYENSGVNFSRTRHKVWPETETYLKKLKEGSEVLDVGCGNGRLLTGVKTKIDYTGIDFSKTLIKIARKKYPQHQFILKDIAQPKTWRKLPKYDAIFCVAVLHHISEKKSQLFILKEIQQHLKKGGFLYISVWNLFKSNRIKHHFKQGSLKLKLKNWRCFNTYFSYS